MFIYPGHRFRVVDGLITNFHLPRSSLLMLVSALGGREAVLRRTAKPWPAATASTATAMRCLWCSEIQSSVFGL